MRYIVVSLTLIVGVVYLGFRKEPDSRLEEQPNVSPVADASDLSQAGDLLRRQPRSFIPNLGQWDHGARYLAQFGAMTLYLEDDGWTFTIVEGAPEESAERISVGPVEPHPSGKVCSVSQRGVAVRMAFKDASTEALEPVDRQQGVHNYFLGNKPENWRSEVPLYGAVRYAEILPGVDVLARQQEGQFEYDLMLQPEADLAQVEITVEGIEGMRIDADGALVLGTVLGPVRMPPPPSWETGPLGEQCEIAVRYLLRGDDSFGFEVSDRRPGWSMVVDPGIVWSTLFGGVSFDAALALALDTQGAVTVVGRAREGWNFPTTPGAYSTVHNGKSGIYGDGFVTRLDASGSSLIYSTFIGGKDGDEAYAVDVMGDGSAVVAGMTRSMDFPTTGNAFDSVLGGGQDGFVIHLSPLGSSLAYSTYLGGNGSEWPMGVAVDTQFCATVVGLTQSLDYPVTPGAHRSVGNRSDGFVTRMSLSGSGLIYSSILGGAGLDVVKAVVVDSLGAATVTGQTSSPDFPTTTGAFATTNSGFDDAFVTRLSPLGTTLIYSTFLGGGAYDRATALVMDARGAVFVTGSTNSLDFPATPGVYGPAKDPHYLWDAFVAKVSPTGSSLDYSTYIGGSGADYGYGIALDAAGSATVVGSTGARDFPTTPDAFERHNRGGTNAFITRLSPTGSELIYSTLLAASGSTEAFAVVSDPQGVVTVVGETYPSGFPTGFPTTPGAFRRTGSGWSDAFVTRIDVPPSSVAIYGAATRGCSTSSWPVISANSRPEVGNAGFSLSCLNAPWNGMGVLMIGGSRFRCSPVILGVEVLVDWRGPFFFVGSLQGSQFGAASFALPIPAHASIRLLDVYAQFVWINSTSGQPWCPSLDLSASSALHITVR